tara:strand:+ start:656 stop:1522 length:867 start_codon:yes stop_codon:yes gene_type:complete
MSKYYLFLFLFSTSLFIATAQSTSVNDIKKLAIELDKEFKGFEMGDVKARGVVSIGRKLIYMYDVPDYWEPFEDAKVRLIKSLIQNGNDKLYTEREIDLGYIYFKDNTPINIVDINWEEFNSEKFILGEYLNLTTHPKSNGLEFKIKPPIGWKVSEGDRPHIVKKFIDKQKAYMIFIKETGQFISEEDVLDMFKNDTEIKSFISSMNQGQEFKLGDYRLLTVDNHPFLYYNGDLKIERLGKETIFKNHIWVSFIEDQFIYFMGGDSSNIDSYNDFLKITNTVIFLNQY